MRTEIIVCDICGKRKEKSNGWLNFLINEAGFHLYVKSDQAKDICSDSCAMKALAEFLDNTRIHK